MVCYVGHVANIDTVDQRILLIPSKRLMWLNWNRRHLSIIYGSVTINGSGIIYGSGKIYGSGIIYSSGIYMVVVKSMVVVSFMVVA